MAKVILKSESINSSNIDDMDLPSNSKRERETTKEKKVEKVITGKVIKRKQGLGKKFAEMFMGEGSDMTTVVNYVFMDILIPSAKGMIYDMITGGVEMKFFGTSSGRRGNRDGSNKSKVSYNNYSKTDYKTNFNQSSRAKHNFDDIILETRGEAEAVLYSLIDLVDEYGMASVADFYSSVDITPEFTDDNYGWEDIRMLKSVKVIRVREGYILDLPKPRSLK